MNKAQEIIQALGKRYPAPEWAFLPQVRNGTGVNRTTRTADAIAMGLYPSRGLHLHGFEVKVSKSDWKRELKDPDKAEVIAQHCHFWWIAAPKGIVDVGDMPVMWGLLEYEKGVLAIAKKPVQLEPEPISLSLLASILRKVQSSTIPVGEVEDLVKYRIEQRDTSELDFRNREIEQLNKALDIYREFEQVSGISVHGYNRGNIAEAVRVIVNKRMNPDFYGRSLEEIRNTTKHLMSHMDLAIKGVAALEEIEAREALQHGDD